eukprot:TRINITY_DN21634_c1_g1_i4.p1 TRINITY_DN21634_c1_g1~~TRINITY_DN21634_c1_g1_i4.p1  ORF type:complete len:573 (-),score=80.67 TRINITY_DN21634_c1_g1_i4:29-1747(-)
MALPWQQHDTEPRVWRNDRSFDALLLAVRDEHAALEQELDRLQALLPEGSWGDWNGREDEQASASQSTMEPAKPGLGMPTVRPTLFEAVSICGDSMSTPRPPDLFGMVHGGAVDKSVEGIEKSSVGKGTKLDFASSSSYDNADGNEPPLTMERKISRRFMTMSNAQMVAEVKKQFEEVRLDRQGSQVSNLSADKTMREAVLDGTLNEFLYPEQKQNGAAVSLSAARVAAQGLLRGTAFEVCISLFLIIDFVLLGLHAHMRLHPETLPPSVSDVTDALDVGCKVVYAAELVLRLYAFGLWSCLQSPFVRLDMFLVSCSTTDLFLEATGLAAPGFLSELNLMRILRVARRVRALRLSLRLRTLWLLISGLTHCAQTILWTFMLIFSITYLFAVMGMEMIAPADLSTDTEHERVATECFGTMSDAMLTLLQVLTLDSIALFYRPLIMEGPVSQGLGCTVYLLLYILFVSIALMNLVTAVMVESSLTQAQQDKEFLQKVQDREREQMLPEIHEMFDALDESGEGEVSLKHLLLAPRHVQQELVALTGSDNPAEIFYLLDMDDSGTIQILSVISVIV